MSSSPEKAEDFRAKILSQPDLILEDQDVMRALVAANERSMGGNVVDMRGLAMERLEARLDRLEDTHRNVIAAAYENLAGTNMIHRAILRLLDAEDFQTLLTDLAGPVADTLRVDSLRVLIERAADDTEVDLGPLGAVLDLAEQGYCCLYAGVTSRGTPRRVTLRQCDGADPDMHGAKADHIRSEACLYLNLGRGRLPAMLVLGAEDPHQFSPGQGTDLLDFFAGVVERTLRRWI
ncbi:hypothetical protein SAMN04488012_103200 [Palleronia salina]|uniref:Recombinase XerC n=2 Tax=Palleronia TaxID=315422 RepID=A0A1M6ES99_9RHOB|nr:MULTISPECIES: DUF484 family protein [Palleronia]SEN77111.1 hypothetical protein SAMN04488011_106118 [Palleronia pelagia]SHI88283.1 hypothetical protein SAMN04488012_103200 [Palleronia salina]